MIAFRPTNLLESCSKKVNMFVLNEYKAGNVKVREASHMIAMGSVVIGSLNVLMTARTIVLAQIRLDAKELIQTNP